MAYQFRGGGVERARMISCARVAAAATGARCPDLAPRNNKYVQYLRRTNYGRTIRRWPVNHARTVARSGNGRRGRGDGDGEVDVCREVEHGRQ